MAQGEKSIQLRELGSLGLSWDPCCAGFLRVLVALAQMPFPTLRAPVWAHQKQQSYESDSYAFLRATPNERVSYGNGRVRTLLYCLGGNGCKFQTLAMIL